MAKIWVGVSETLGFKELIVQYLDPYFAPVDQDEDPVGQLELNFGASRIQPGTFEAYEKPAEFEEIFDSAFVFARFPFPDHPPGLKAVDWRKARTAFFVINELDPKIFKDANVTITDVLEVRFDWE